MKTNEEIWADVQSKTAEFEVGAAKVGLYHRGYRFWPPYACGRCGEPISARQFAFARSCGGCDHSRSQTARLHLYDPRWFVLGKVEYEDPNDSALIRVDFIPAYTRRDFALIEPPKPWPLPRHFQPRPRPTRSYPWNLALSRLMKPGQPVTVSRRSPRTERVQR